MRTHHICMCQNRCQIACYCSPDIPAGKDFRIIQSFPKCVDHFLRIAEVVICSPLRYPDRIHLPFSTRFHQFFYNFPQFLLSASPLSGALLQTDPQIRFTLFKKLFCLTQKLLKLTLFLQTHKIVMSYIQQRYSFSSPISCIEGLPSFPLLIPHPSFRTGSPDGRFPAVSRAVPYP